MLLGRRLELTAPQGVLRGDRERHLRGVDAGAADADPALDEGAEHREEALVGVLDRALVDPGGGHVGEPVEHRLARHPDAVEPQPAVVDAVEAHLRAVVLDPDAVADLALLADRHHEGVHALGPAAELELGEDHGHLGVGGGVADVVLVGLGAAGLDHELLGGHVVRRDRAERLHVAAVPGLGHREAAHQPTGDEVLEVAVVVLLGAELEDRAAEQAELHADLDQHRQVAERERLERRHRRPDVAAAAVGLGEAHAGLPGRGHLERDVLDPLAEVGGGHRLGVVEDRGVLGEVARARAGGRRRTCRRAASSGPRRRPPAARRLSAAGSAPGWASASGPDWGAAVSVAMGSGYWPANPPVGRFRDGRRSSA